MPALVTQRLFGFGVSAAALLFRYTVFFWSVDQLKSAKT